MKLARHTDAINVIGTFPVDRGYPCARVQGQIVVNQVGEAPIEEAFIWTVLTRGTKPTYSM